MNLNRLHYLEASLVGAYGCTSRQNALALELMAQGRIRVDHLVSHHLPLSRVAEGLELVLSRRGLKIVIDFDLYENAVRAVSRKDWIDQQAHYCFHTWL